MRIVKNIPEEYLSNNETDLKRAAIINRDTELLQALKASTDQAKGWKLYFAKADETVFRDEKGNEVPFKSFVIDPYNFGLHFCMVQYARPFSRPWVGDFPPGHIYQCILGDQQQCTKVLVMELPSDTVFPLPDGFGWNDWVSTCNDYLKREGVVFRTYADWIEYDRLGADRFFERPTMKMYEYKHDLGHTLITNAPPPDNRPFKLV